MSRLISAICDFFRGKRREWKPIILNPNLIVPFDGLSIDKGNISVGERFLACLSHPEPWFGNDWRPATLHRITPTGRYDVRWDNGFSSVSRPEQVLVKSFDNMYYI